MIADLFKSRTADTETNKRKSQKMCMSAGVSKMPRGKTNSKY